MAPAGRLSCTECEAQLRRGRPPGLCDPCARKGLDVHRALPPSFYDNPKVKAVLGDYDFGRFFRMVRRYTGWTQETLAGIVELTQADISKMERGKWHLQDVSIVHRIAQRLGIPSVLLGFGPTVGDADLQRKVASWVDRRHFTNHVAGLFLSIAGATATGLDLDRLTALLPTAEPTGTRHVGAADVAAIEHATAALSDLQRVHGGGLSQAAAVAQLRSVLPLLRARSTPEVRSRLLVATGHLAMEAGYMSHDVHQHEAARRLWLMALDLARETDDPRGADLTVAVLADIAACTLNLGEPQEALHLVRVAQLAAEDHRHRLTGSTRSFLAHNQARAHAALGDTAACDRAISQVGEQFRAADPADRTPWAAATHVTALEGWQGWARYEQALTTRDPRAASQAVVLLRHRLDNFPPGHNRDRAFDLAKLSGAHAIAGDTGTAVTVGHEAVDAVAGLSTHRAHDQLRTLHTVLQPLQASPGVAELRDRLATTAA